MSNENLRQARSFNAEEQGFQQSALFPSGDYYKKIKY